MVQPTYQINLHQNDNEGNKIPFRVDKNREVFINATEMVEPFPTKRINNFLRNKEILE